MKKKIRGFVIVMLISGIAISLTNWASKTKWNEKGLKILQDLEFFEKSESEGLVKFANNSLKALEEEKAISNFRASLDQSNPSIEKIIKKYGKPSRIKEVFTTTKFGPTTLTCHFFGKIGFGTLGDDQVTDIVIGE